MYENYVRMFKDLKSQGVPKDEVLDVLEFDSDEYPDMEELVKARDFVYGN